MSGQTYYQKLLVGDRVRVHSSGSWTDGKVMTVLRLNTVSPDGIYGHLLQAGPLEGLPNGAQTVVGEHELERVE